jgi:hypothetical protein
MGIEKEGSIAFRLRHPDKDWSTNDKPYRFNTVEIGPIRAWAMKNPDRSVEFHVSGPLNSEITLNGQLQAVGERGVHVVITWSEKEVQLYLDARPHTIVRLPPPKQPGQADA